jgi:hypothetical protein
VTIRAAPSERAARAFAARPSPTRPAAKAAACVRGPLTARLRARPAHSWIAPACGRRKPVSASQLVAGRARRRPAFFCRRFLARHWLSNSAQRAQYASEVRGARERLQHAVRTSTMRTHATRGGTAHGKKGRICTDSGYRARGPQLAARGLRALCARCRSAGHSDGPSIARRQRSRPDARADCSLFGEETVAYLGYAPKALVSYTLSALVLGPVVVLLFTLGSHTSAEHKDAAADDLGALRLVLRGLSGWSQMVCSGLALVAIAVIARSGELVTMAFPPNLSEFFARVRTVARRTHLSPIAPREISFAMYPDTLEVQVAEHTAVLSATAFRLVRYLARNAPALGQARRAHDLLRDTPRSRLEPDPRAPAPCPSSARSLGALHRDEAAPG